MGLKLKENGIEVERKCDWSWKKMRLKLKENGIEVERKCDCSWKKKITIRLYINKIETIIH